MNRKRDPNRSFGTVCCVPLCKNNSRFSKGISFHAFPNDAKLRKEWIRRVQRTGSNGKFSKWCPSKYHKICGIHFNKSGKKTYDDKLPCFFPNKTYKNRILNTNVPSTSSVKDKSSLYDQIIYPVQFDDSSPSFSMQHAADTDFDLGCNVVIDHTKKNESNVSTTPSASTGSNSTECTSEDKHFHTYAYTGEHDTINSFYKLKKSLDDCITSNGILESENTALKEEVKKLKKQLSASVKRCNITKTKLTIEKSKSLPTVREFSLKSIINDDKKIRFYTGFANKERLNIFLNFIIEGYRESRKETSCRNGRPRSLDVENEIFLVLCRLRLGLLEADLANRFQIGVSVVNKIWQFWVHLISTFLVQMPIWPSRETVDKFMPSEFKEMYPTTRVILDCTELFIENPSEFNVQSNTYSSYKSHNTAKGLIGITPNGFVSLISDLVPGRVSDKVITSNSGLYAKLQPGDSVMADRGFLIEDSLKEISVGLNIPPFLKGKPQLSIADEKLTRDIAKLRIHVERVIRGVKQFRILKYVFPNSMADKLDPIWKICCHLMNFIDEPLLERNVSPTETVLES